MQNFDFYSGQSIKSFPPQFESKDPEYFSRYSASHISDHEKVKKKASRLIFLITAFIILSFTTGLITGIKFAGGKNKDIVDESTQNAISQLKTKVTDLIARDKGDDTLKKSYPASVYPYVIKIGNTYNKASSRELAEFLSRKGHTVILSKFGDQEFNVYTGPYKNLDTANSAFKLLDSYGDSRLKSNIQIISRKTS